MIIFLLLSIFVSLNQTISVSEHQAEGLELIIPTSKVIQLVQRYRSSLILQRFNGDKITPEIDRTSEKLTSAYIRLEQSLPKKIRSSNEWAIIQNDLTRLRNTHQQLDVNEIHKLTSLLVTRVIDLNRAISQEYKLAVNDNIGTVYLLNTVVNQLPILLEDLGQLTTSGVTALGDHEGLISPNTLLLSAEKSLSKLKNTIEHIKLNTPLMRDNITRSTEDIIYSADQLISNFKEINPSIDDPYKYFLDSTLLLDKSYTSIHSALLFVRNDVINNQSLSAKESVFLLGVVTSLIMLLIIYLSFGNYLSVASSVKLLSEATDRFAEGDLSSRALVNSKDEIGKICETFNRLADGFGDLIQETKQSERRLNSIINSSMDGVIQLDSNGIITGWSERAESILGWLSDDMVGQNITTHVIPMNQEGLEHYSQINDLLSKYANTTPVERIELKASAQSGDVIDVELSVSNISLSSDSEDEFIALIRDISRKKELLDRFELSYMFFNSSSEAMFITDAENKIIAINPSFTQVTGYVQEEVLGKTPSILNSGRQDTQFFEAMWNELKLNGSWRGEIWNKRKDGTAIIGMLSISTIFNENGSIHKRVAIFSDITDKKKNKDIIWRQANFDSITNLPNRHMFSNKLEDMIKHSKRYNSSFALMFIDLDRFKEVNDSLGHEAGDDLLKQVSSRLTDCVRESDTVARLGGDEFTIILDDIAEAQHISKVAQTIVEEIAKPFNISEEKVYISASIGIASFPHDAKHMDDLLSKSDQAMYQAKTLGKNRYALFTREIHEKAKRKIDLVNSLRTAIANNEFSLNYQPIIELNTGRIVKAEALLRWINPEKGFISPADFIPIAEDAGFINEIGEWVFNEAVKEVAHIRQSIDPSFQININKSPLQFARKNDHDSWLELLGEYNLSGSSIGLEITEGVLMGSPENVKHQLLEFRDSGIEISIDDFGTGYSSLAYLQDFDIDYLKIDQKFTRGVTEGDRTDGNKTLIESIIAMAHKLNIKVVAEGVETQEQLDFMKSVKCDYVQGYFISTPLTADDFEVLLSDSIDAITNPVVQAALN
jgi:diguanylate cyclase (GGDEF)-like protein/PAS domain S-box-containing protein